MLNCKSVMVQKNDMRPNSERKKEILKDHLPVDIKLKKFRCSPVLLFLNVGQSDTFDNLNEFVRLT